MTRHIVFIVSPAFELLDLSGPLSAFDMARRHEPDAYRLTVASETGGLVTCSSGVGVTSAPLAGLSADTLVVAGGPELPGSAVTPSLVAAFLAAAGDARRVTSVCTGAFLLAAAGLLDGRRATTHWRAAPLLQAAFPRVRVDADRIFIEDGRIWSSAGITAGIDLALALVEADLGVEAARRVARDLVVYHRRPGGQSQFSALLELEPPSDRIRAALAFAREHLHEPLPVDRLADAARLSPRQFGRAFLAGTGQTPAKAVERLRAETARAAVEDGAEPLEQIARRTGFGDPERMRLAFIRAFGHPPQALRRAARTGSPRPACGEREGPGDRRSTGG